MIIIKLVKPDLAVLTNHLIRTANYNHEVDQCYQIDSLEQIDDLLHEISKNKVQDKFEFKSGDKILSLNILEKLRSYCLDVRK